MPDSFFPSSRTATRRGLAAAVLAGALIVVFAVDASDRWRSELFPEDWSPALTDDAGRFLHDISYAGYRNGEAPLPELSGAAVFDVVADFGADPNGEKDATGPIQAAIDAAEAGGGGVVRIPAGLYILHGLLLVDGPGIVIRGAGSGKSRIFSVRSEGMSGKSLLTIRGETRYGTEVPLAADARPRETAVLVADASSLSVGDDVDVGFTITDEFVAEHGMTGVWKAFNGKWQPFFRRQVVSIDTETSPQRVELDVPIRSPAKVRDGASLKVECGMIGEVGVEGIAFSNVVNPEDAVKNDQVHVLELSGVKDAWVRDVRSFLHLRSPETADAHLQSGGILVRHAKRVTVADCRLEAAQHRGGGGNGYLFEVRQSNEVLFRDCTARKGRHNFIQNWGFGVSGCVWLRCESREGEALNAFMGEVFAIVGFSEYHHSLATANLVDRCVVDDGWSAVDRGRMSSGAGHTATQCVFWNTTGSGLLRSAQFGHGYVIGTGPELRLQVRGGDWLEGEGRAAELDPPSLYEEQLRRRLR